MARTIDFAIDLGTTNSLIAKSNKGVIDIFKNPAGMKTTLPSVVAFRKDRILVGDKAREYIEKDPSNVFGAFKRKMGTSETFLVPNTGGFKTPIELSTIILQELKHFIFTGETPESVVITIPASFDTIQSNATKEAGYAAGFKEVLLLQEPIAASLAFANRDGKEGMKGSWLVYDLGGGTFDVALVRIEEEEMKVVDHEGDNYFGGVDFDNLLLSDVVVPYLEQKYQIEGLSTKMRSSGGRYNKLYYQLLYKAEEAKIALSAYPSAVLEFDFTDEKDETHEEYLEITREQFEKSIRSRVKASIDFIRLLLERNRLAPSNITEVVLVGGSTYIPLVRNLLARELGIAVNTAIDPTTAVVEGAAYYAGSRASRWEPAETKTTRKTEVDIKMAYARNSRSDEEYFAAIVRQAPAGSQYRIRRSDGGFDSGLKPLGERISEMLVLLPGSLNVFRLQFFDASGALIETDVPEISIVQGKFSIHGQPLPHDICLEVDDTYDRSTHLEVIFERGGILPLKKTITKTLSRSILKGSNDQLLINVLEGSRYGSPQTNLPIGVVGIEGRNLSADLIKGCDIDLTFEISESRDITVTAFISMIDAEYREVFSPSTRAINLARLGQEIDYLKRTAAGQLKKFLAQELYKEGAILQGCIQELEDMQKPLRNLTDKDVTDTKFQLDDQKRKIAQTLESVSREETHLQLREQYFDKKEYYLELITHANRPDLLRKFEQMGKEEAEWINTASTQFIRSKMREMDRLAWDVRRNNLDHVIGIYTSYALRPPEAYSNPKEFKQLRARGDEALGRKNIEEIWSIIQRMYDLLIDKNRNEEIKGTGLRE
ncbi:Hsp70 family protein [Dinghuibacter silviterrae]|uniref:Molecular chaperone DnaK n=1 Tax=Dinghuibacter silviterrae TaxID=1539049 RepID=A0A4R8DRD6_9BACT|nr:Hsp70 family protein [Dinghuibacter silviterrae]TDX00368.1 molecular chaperone DnaK [Dinghuibacter silviterrae]